MNINNKLKKGTSISIDKYKRTHLKWIAPAIVAVTLPNHAQATMCSSSPVIRSDGRCSKNETSANYDRLFTVFSDNEEMEILSIALNAEAGDSLSVSGVPATVSSSSSGVVVSWTGPVIPSATPDVDCVPATSASITVTYNCNSDSSGPFTANFDLKAAF